MSVSLSQFLAKSKAVAAGVSAVALLGSASAALSEESYQNTRVTGGYSWSADPDAVYGWGTEDKDLYLVQFEHFGVWEYGDNYVDTEVFQGNNIGNILGAPVGAFGAEDNVTFFGVWNTRLSLSKTTGHKFSAGLITDVYLANRVEASDYFNFKSENIGLSVDLKVPGASFFETDLYYRYYDFDGATDNDALFSRTFAIFPFKIGRLDMTYEQLLLVSFRSDDKGTDLFSRSDITARIPRTSLDVGTRLEYHTFENQPGEGTGRYNSFTPYIITRWNF